MTNPPRIRSLNLVEIVRKKNLPIQIMFQAFLIIMKNPKNLKPLIYKLRNSIIKKKILEKAFLQMTTF